jgi:hypothetical protein
MFQVSDYLSALLSSRNRDLLYLYEFYAWDYQPFPEPESANLSYDPRHAIARFAGQVISFDLDGESVAYERTVLEGVSINKSIGKKFDTVTIRFSNVPTRLETETEGEFVLRRRMAQFVLNNRVEGMRLVVRMISRHAPIGGGTASQYAHMIIRFVGRVDKPDDFNRESGTLSATQDLGSITTQVPPTLYQPTCPLTPVFKIPGFDCMGDEPLSAKSIEYQSEKICDGLWGTCVRLDNPEFFQGVRIVQLTSSFLHKDHESFFKKVLNVLPGISRRETIVGNSIHDGTPYGSPRSVIFGRWQKELILLQWRDLGESIISKHAISHGPIAAIVDLRNTSPKFSQPLDVVIHLGEYGGVGTQTADAVFPDHSFHSRLAYVTTRCIGSEMISEDTGPNLTGLIAGFAVKKAFGIDGSGTGRLNNVLAGYTTGGLFGWTDNPVDQVRAFLTDPALFALSPGHIGELATAITSAYTTGVVKDESGAEHALFQADQIGKAGVDYKRYHSTGMLGARNFVGLNGVYDREAVYEFDTDGSIEAGTSTLPRITRYRKRFTANLEIGKQEKGIDVLYNLLASFRGFLRWDHFGRLAVDCERPADHSFLRDDLASGSTSITVLDVTRWKPLDLILNLEPPLRGKILIGAHKRHSEVRPVTSADYSADGNSITLDATVTGSLQVDTSGPTLSGGSTSSPAGGYVDILGSPQLGDQITITIDGVEVVYTATQEDDEAGAGPWLPFLLSCMINAEPLLNKYIEAQYGSSPANVDTELDGSWRVLIYCKYGKLNFATPLEEDHFAEIADPEDPPVVTTSAGSLLAGTYLLTYAYRNANGNTNISPILSIPVGADEQIDIEGITLPDGATSVDWFVSVAPESGIRLLVANNDGAAFSINSLPASTSEHEPKRNTSGEEVLRINRSYAGKALTYADTTRANVLDGTFTWPDAGKQSTINQVKGTFRQSIMDFAEQPIIINDERHQRENGGLPKTYDLNLSAVDNYWQAAYLCNSYLAKLRDGDFFFKWGSAGAAHLDEIGDVVCVSDDSGEWRNVPVRVEEATYNPRFEVFFNARLYSTSQFDDAVLQTEVPLPSGLIGPYGAPPNIAFNAVDFPPDGLVQSTDGTAGITTIRGGAIVGSYIYGQFVNVRVIKRAGVTVNETVLSQAIPDDNELVFEFPASAAGVYTVELEVCSMLNVCNTTKPTADIVIGLGARQSRFTVPPLEWNAEIISGGPGEAEGGWVIP